MFEAIFGALAIAAVEPVKAEPKRDPARWVQAGDLPRINEKAAVTTFDLTVDESGEPSHCEIIVRSGSDELDTSVCKAVMKRAKFRPATGIDGSPIFYVRRDRVIWIPQGYGRNKAYDGADLVITSPDVIGKNDALVEVLLTIGEEGAVSKCSVSKSSETELLDDLACRVASDPQIAPPITNAAGEQVPGLRSLFVAFEAGTSLSAKLR